MKKFMNLAEWRKQAEQGAAPTGVTLRKEFVADEVTPIGGGSRVIRFVISTGAVDRASDTLDPNGWRLDNFKKNPVVPWCHMYRELPVAKAVDIAVSAGRLVSDADFATREVYPFADTVFQMLNGGFLRGCSVGFDPIKSAFNNERFGYDFLEQELLEYSVTPVPCNPEALIEAKSVGIDVEPLKAWAERALDEWGGEKGVWIPRSRLEAARKAIAPKTFQILGIKDDGGPEGEGDAGECPMGSECPMEEGMESCPNGEKCAKKSQGAANDQPAAPKSVKLELDLGPLKAMLEEKLGGFDAKLREVMAAAQKLALPSGATLAIDGQVLAGDFTLEVAPDDPGPQEKLFQFDPEELRGVVSDALHAEMTTITGKLYDRS